MGNTLSTQEFMTRLLKLEAHDAILNCFHRFLQYLSLQHKQGVLDCFALDREDVSYETGKSGVFVGREALDHYFDYLYEAAKLKGLLYEQYTYEQVIEIAGDGKTAKLTSISPGININAPARIQAWSKGKFYVDFVLEQDGSWKIWHLHRFLTYEAEMERGPLHTQYTETVEKSVKEYADCFQAQPTAAPTYFQLFDPKKRNYPMPEPPAPYGAWDGMTDLVRTRPYQNPDLPETMEHEVESVIRLGRGDEGYGKAW